MSPETIKQRTKTCIGCQSQYVVKKGKSVEKTKFCNFRCYLDHMPRSHYEDIARMKTTHGMTGTRIYEIYRAMKQRCLNKKSTNYKGYGGAGITVCPKWLTFQGFYEDMKDGYADNLSIDRIDNTKGYYKENCRWATNAEQCSNTRRNVYVDCDGELLCMAQCAQKLGVNRSTIYLRIRKGEMERITPALMRERLMSKIK